jgi:hypothetical protein
MDMVLGDVRQVDGISRVRDLDFSAAGRLPSTLFKWIDQTLCGLTGHDDFLRFEPLRLSLYCNQCGYRSAGWELHQPRMARPDKPEAVAGDYRVKAMH